MFKDYEHLLVGSIICSLLYGGLGEMQAAYGTVLGYVFGVFTYASWFGLGDEEPFFTLDSAAPGRSNAA